MSDKELEVPCGYKLISPCFFTSETEFNIDDLKGIDRRYFYDKGEPYTDALYRICHGYKVITFPVMKKGDIYTVNIIEVGAKFFRRPLFSVVIKNKSIKFLSHREYFWLGKEVPVEEVYNLIQKWYKF